MKSQKKEPRSALASSAVSNDTSSFKQIIRGVQSLLLNDEEESQSYGISKFDPCLNDTNGWKIQQLMQDTNIRQKADRVMKQHGYFDTFPVLRVAVVSITNDYVEYQLSQDDLTQVFNRFGNLQKVIINSSGGFIFYTDYHSAYFAERVLNDIIIKCHDAKLMVRWCEPNSYHLINQYLNYDRQPELTRNNSCNSTNAAPKFTCRYEIQIENERQFQVARKIIGAKGFNMKKIIDTCLLEIGADPKTEADSIKLRLRGKGSGYREGPNKLESQQPLHLCISCKDEQAYNTASRLVEELLRGVYQQYKYFTSKSTKKAEQLTIKKLDVTSLLPVQPVAKNSFYLFDSQPSVNDVQQLSDNEIKTYIEARNRARRELNFGEADRIRNYLKAKGITLIDEKGGRGKGIEVTTWRYCL